MFSRPLVDLIRANYDIRQYRPIPLLFVSHCRVTARFGCLPVFNPLNHPLHIHPYTHNISTLHI